MSPEPDHPRRRKSDQQPFDPEEMNRRIGAIQHVIEVARDRLKEQSWFSNVPGTFTVGNTTYEVVANHDRFDTYLQPDDLTVINISSSQHLDIPSHSGLCIFMYQRTDYGLTQPVAIQMPKTPNRVLQEDVINFREYTAVALDTLAEIIQKAPQMHQSDYYAFLSRR